MHREAVFLSELNLAWIQDQLAHWDCRLAEAQQAEVAERRAELIGARQQLASLCTGLSARDQHQQAVCAQQGTELTNTLAHLDELAGRYASACNDTAPAAPRFEPSPRSPDRRHPMATLTPAFARLRPAVLAALMAWAPLSGAAPQGTPITIDSPPAVPSADIQGTIAHLEGFLDQTDRYIRAVQVTSERYRQYLEQNKALWASCQVKADLGGYEKSRFSRLNVAGDAECRHYATEMDQTAQAVAAQLDVAVKFQKEAQFFARRW